MNQTERRIYLIKELQKDKSQLSNYEIPADEQGQKDLLRGLMNIWMPKPITEEYLKIESEYLRTENEAKGITKLSDLTPIEKDLYLISRKRQTLNVLLVYHLFVQFTRFCNCSMAL